MLFEIKNKVALITGGARGIGLSIAKEILLNEAKGLVLADIDSVLGVTAQRELEKAFGPNKCVFVHTDVTDSNHLEAAFLRTIEHYGSIDILFNNAGVACGKRWEKGIAIHLNGTIHGMLLGFDKYLQKYKQGSEAVIVNTSSIFGVNACGAAPVYSAVKSAIVSTVKSWGIPEYYEETKVRVVGICPGFTDTPILQNIELLGEKYDSLAKQFQDFPMQKPDFVAKETMEVVKFAPNGTVWIIEGGEPAYEYPLSHRSEIKRKLIGSS